MACFKQAKCTQSGKNMSHSYRHRYNHSMLHSYSERESLSAFTSTEHKERSICCKFPSKNQLFRHLNENNANKVGGFHTADRQVSAGKFPSCFEDKNTGTRRRTCIYCLVRTSTDVQSNDMNLKPAIHSIAAITTVAQNSVQGSQRLYGNQSLPLTILAQWRF